MNSSRGRLGMRPYRAGGLSEQVVRRMAVLIDASRRNGEKGVVEGMLFLTFQIDKEGLTRRGYIFFQKM